MACLQAAAGDNPNPNPNPNPKPKPNPNQASVFNGTRPRLAVQVHANVPGIGDSLWDLYLHPWQHYLQSQGCELRLTTVLRGGSERLKADFDASSGANGGGDFCAFAADHSNAQTKYLLSGSPF